MYRIVKMPSSSRQPFGSACSVCRINIGKNKFTISSVQKLPTKFLYTIYFDYLPIVNHTNIQNFYAAPADVLSK